MTLVAGVLCSAGLAAALVAGPVTARPEHHHVVYSVDLWAGPAVVLLYVLSTCGAFLVSGRRFLRRFGTANLVAVLLLAWVATDAVTSLWCVWAAAASITVAAYLRRAGDADVVAAPG